ncbi:heat-shock related protein [Scheffersomyces xylosifermentans]|uniref:heat-shock related protein n=1 Tax=Scheffersomyces xylosifermentans TaxID=1304137 RepID=UPI00315D487E
MSRKSDPPVKKNAFVHKLYTMLNDPKLTHLIWWTENDGDLNTFALFPGKEFATALTGYFKHGNVASFVRQLHMYGFHKVSDPSPSPNNALNHSNGNSTSNGASNHDGSNNGAEEVPPVWEFKHSSGKFKKGDEGALIYIKRRSSSNSSRNNSYNGDQQQLHHPQLHQLHHPHNQLHQPGTVVVHSTPSPNSYEHHYYQQQQQQHQQQHPQQYITGPYYSVPLPPPNSQPHSHTLPLPQPKPLESISTLVSSHYPALQQSQYPYPSPYAAGTTPATATTSYHYATDHRQSQAPFPRPETVAARHSETPSSGLYHTSYSKETGVVRHKSDPSSRSAGSIQVQPQHYTPNLQFRKIWENSGSSSNSVAVGMTGVSTTSSVTTSAGLTTNSSISSTSTTSPPLAKRPRNPSLLYDPLAPAPANVSPPADTQNHQQYQPQQPQQPQQQPQQQHGASQYPYQYQRSPYLPLSRNNSVTTSSFPRESFSSDSSKSRSSSIKLPPPSSLQRVNSVTSATSYPLSPEPPREESPVPTIPNQHPLPRSIPTNFEASQPQAGSGFLPQTSASIPGSPSVGNSNGPGAKKPSLVPLSGSLHERLRPSLIELHFGPGSAAAAKANPSMLRQQDSIGSHSSHNSIFSNKSSVSSISSFQRTSSFGSISHHPIMFDPNNKNSISISPHDTAPATGQTTTTEYSEEVRSPGTFVSLTPPPSKLGGKSANSTNSPIVRSTSIPTTVRRSLTSSPFTKSTNNGAGEDTDKEDRTNKKVSVKSLLEDSSSNGKSMIHSVIAEDAGSQEQQQEIKRQRLA